MLWLFQSDVQNSIAAVEKLGEVLIDGMKRAGNITEPKTIQVKSNIMGKYI